MSPFVLSCGQNVSSSGSSCSSIAERPHGCSWYSEGLLAEPVFFFSFSFCNFCISYELSSSSRTPLLFLLCSLFCRCWGVVVVVVVGVVVVVIGSREPLSVPEWKGLGGSVVLQ